MKVASPVGARKVKVLIVFYSMYGHVEALARRMKSGAESLEGVEAALFRIPETLPEGALSRMRAPQKDCDIPVMDSTARLAEADGFLFDSTAHLWRAQALAGKPAGFFVSTGTQRGGQETTA